jgi:2-oxoisovalerate dehydrogenase E1 component
MVTADPRWRNRGERIASDVRINSLEARIQACTNPAEACSLFERDQHGKPLIPVEPSAVYGFGLLLRKTEELLLQLFSQGLLSGTTHTCLGQELCQLAVVRALLDPDDVVLSNHRNHGHFLTYSGEFRGLLAEIMGREAGVCGGIGGSQHLAYRHFHSNGVQGGMTAIGAGHALAIKKRNGSAIVVAIVGDGTLGQGLLYESMNLAAVWDAPMLFVVENNGIAQTTPTSQTIGGSIQQRGTAFGLKTWHLDDATPDFLQQVERVVEEIRFRRRPGFLVIDTCRLGPHSKGDDLREASEMQRIRERDPLARMAWALPEAERRSIEEAVSEFIEVAHREALNSPEAKAAEPRRHIFALAALPEAREPSNSGKCNVRGAINTALDELLAGQPEVILLGEDLHDPYGGAFKVTAGLSTKYPGRVMSSPISEAGITGAGIGLALAGFRPVTEIMFADFVTLAMDQLFNHAVKFPGMFPDAHVPLVIRTPSGGRRGYGPTHSQSPEMLMSAVPGLTVVFPSRRHDPAGILKDAVLRWPYPTIFFEHKLLYSQTVDPSGYRVTPADPADPGSDLFPTLAGGSQNPDLTIVCYGAGVELAENVAGRLAEEEIEVEIVIPSLLAPLPRRSMVELLRQRERILVFGEGNQECGYAAELGAVLHESGYRGAFQRVGPPPVPIPAARSLEAQVLPGEAELFDAAVQMILNSAFAAV